MTMIDRENVIKGLEHLRETIRTATQYTFTSGSICAINIKRIDNAIAMLKEKYVETELCERCGRVRLKSKWEGR